VLTERTATYRVVDEATVQWIGLPGFIDPDYARNFFAPLPRHRYAGLTPEQIADSDEANTRPLGWGPFMVQDWTHGKSLTLTRNPHYPGAVWAATVTYHFVPDADCTVALAEAPGLIAQSAESTVFWHLDFNLAEDGRWAEVATRRAIALCLNRSAFTTNVPATYLPVAHPLRAAEVAPIPFDPAQGRALLSHPFSFTLAYGASGEAIAQTIQYQLKNNCDVDVELRPLTRGELEGDWPEGVIFGRHYDAAVFAWDTEVIPPCQLWMSAEIASDENPGGANNTGYANPAFDVACRRARTRLDPAQAAVYHAEAQRLWARDVPVLPLFFATRRAAMQPSAQGFTLETGSPSALWNIELFSVGP
jgi:peptide/nickel transport system substrate-binding protein